MSREDSATEGLGTTEGPGRTRAETPGTGWQGAVPQRFNKRDGYVVRDSAGRYVFISERALSLKRELELGNIDSTRMDAKDQQLADELAQAGLVMRDERPIKGPAISSVSPRRAAAVYAALYAFAFLGAIGMWLWHYALPPHPPLSQLSAQVVSGGGLTALAWFVGVAVSLFLHEIGHLGALRFLGGEPGRIRVRAVGPVIAAVSRVSGVWMLPRSRRVAVSVAGPAVSCALGGIFVLAALLPASAGDPRSVCLSLATVNLIAVIFSANPFLRVDAYFVVAHVLNRPNLMSLAFVELARSVQARRLASGLAWYAVAVVLSYAGLAVLQMYLLHRYIVAGAWLPAAIVAAGLSWFAFRAVNHIGGRRRRMAESGSA